MTNPNTTPDGWTQNMKPLDTDPTLDMPVVQRGGSANLAQQQQRGSQQSAQSGVQGQESQAPTTAGEEYWKAQCMEARETANKLLPLAPYADTIAYLDSNPGAVQVVMNYMRNPQSFTNGAPNEGIGENSMESALYGNQGNAGQVQPNPSMAQPTVNQGGALNTTNVRRALHQQFDGLLKQAGFPDHESDKFITWMMNSEAVPPEDFVEMYKILQERSGGVGAVPNVPNPVQNGTQQQPAQQQGQVEAPPMSIAAMNGGTANPRDERGGSEENQTRISLDPNTV